MKKFLFALALVSCRPDSAGILSMGIDTELGVQYHTSSTAIPTGSWSHFLQQSGGVGYGSYFELTQPNDQARLTIPLDTVEGEVLRSWSVDVENTSDHTLIARLVRTDGDSFLYLSSSSLVAGAGRTWIGEIVSEPVLPGESYYITIGCAGTRDPSTLRFFKSRVGTLNPGSPNPGAVKAKSCRIDG
jgi:hypothetical protein